MSDLLSKIRELRARMDTGSERAKNDLVFLLVNHLDEIEKALEEKRT